MYIVQYRRTFPTFLIFVMFQSFKSFRSLLVFWIFFLCVLEWIALQRFNEIWCRFSSAWFISAGVIFQGKQTDP